MTEADIPHRTENVVQTNVTTTMDPPRVLPCFVCGKELRSSMPGEREPYPATVFTSHGNYGSTLFDDDYRWLRIHICDVCLEAAGEQLRVECGSSFQPPSVRTYVDWSAEYERKLDERSAREAEASR